MEVLLIAFLLILIVRVRTESCSGELERCLVVLQSVAKSDDLALATTKQELERVCRELQVSVRCIDEHSSRCFDSAQLQVYNSVVSGSRQVIEDICVEGKLQKDYLTHAPCFKNISTDSKKCASKYRKVAILSQDLTEEDKDSALKSVCWCNMCSYLGATKGLFKERGTNLLAINNVNSRKFDFFGALRDFTNCKHEHAVRDCGPGASQFLLKHMDRMSDSFINEHCVLYTYGPSSCPTNVSDSLSISKENAQQTIVFIFTISVLYFSILIQKY